MNSKIIECFGFERSKVFAKYPNNSNFNLKTGDLKYDNLNSQYGEFIGYVSVFDIRKAVEWYKNQNKIFELNDMVRRIGSKQTYKVCHSNNTKKVHVIGQGEFRTFYLDEVEIFNCCNEGFK